MSYLFLLFRYYIDIISVGCRCCHRKCSRKSNESTQSIFIRSSKLNAFLIILLQICFLPCQFLLQLSFLLQPLYPILYLILEGNPTFIAICSRRKQKNEGGGGKSSLSPLAYKKDCEWILGLQKLKCCKYLTSWMLFKKIAQGSTLTCTMPLRDMGALNLHVSLDSRNRKMFTKGIWKEILIMVNLQSRPLPKGFNVGPRLPGVVYFLNLLMHNNIMFLIFVFVYRFYIHIP